jgi:hypothetical protein
MVERNISYNGINGGSITLTNAGVQSASPAVANQIVNGTIIADGTTGNGGTILFQGQQPAGSAQLTTQFNNGTVEATNNADNSGIIGFNGGANTNIVISGTGTVNAGQVVRAGALDPNTLALLPISSGTILISPTVSISNALETNGFIPPPPTPTPTPTPPTPDNGGGHIIINGGNSSSNSNDVSVISKTDTDLTPIYGYVSLSEEDEKRRSRRATRRNKTSIIPGAKSYNHTFNGKELSQLIQEGIQLKHPTAENHLNLDKGNVLLSPDKDIVVGTHEGNIHMAAGAIAFIMESGNDVVIYDLRQSGPKQINIVVGKNELTLHPGHMMVLTREHVTDFEDIDTECHMISYRGAQQIPLTHTEVKAFAAEFSIASAIITIKPLNELIASESKDDHVVLEKIIKGAVMLNDFSGTIDMEQLANLAYAGESHD